MEMLDTSEVNGNEMSLRTQILKRSDREARTPGYDDQDTALLIENICASSGGKTLGDIPMHLSYRLKRNGSQARLSGAQLSHYDQGAEYTLPYFSREHSQALRRFKSYHLFEFSPRIDHQFTRIHG
jgi:hypothetical protein